MDVSAAHGRPTAHPCGLCRAKTACIAILLILVRAFAASGLPGEHAARKLDLTYRPPPIWGCEVGLQPTLFHVVIATYAPEPTALIPWIWNLGLGGAEVWIYHRLEQSDPRLSDIQDALRALEPFPCDMRVRLQQLLPNKGREAAVYLTHIVNHYNALPQAMVLVHDHGPAARHSLCGPFFRRVRGYYIGVREQLKAAGSGSGAETGTVSSSAAVGQAGGAETAMVAGVGGRGGGAVGAAGPGGGSRRALLGSSRKRGGASSTASSSRKLKVLAAFANMTVSLSSGCQENWLKGCCALLVCAEDGDPPEGSLDDYGLGEPVGGGAVSGGAATGPQQQQQVQLPLQRQLLQLGLDEGGDAGLTGPLGQLAWARGSKGWPEVEGEEEREEAAEARLGEWDGNVEEEVAGAGVSRRRLEQMAQAQTGALKKWPGRPIQRGRCPFRTSKCLANASAMTVPLASGVAGMGRWLYMHGGGGLYDTRYENLVTLYGETAQEAAAAAFGGQTNMGFGPLSLVRYGGPGAFETVRGQASSSRSLDYPQEGQGVAVRSKEETFAALGAVLSSHGFAQGKMRGNFKSCCASFMLRPTTVRHWPLKMYEEMLSYTLDARNTYHASLAVSHHGWAMWGGTHDVGPSDLLRYFEVDLALLHIRGCPGWRMALG